MPVEAVSISQPKSTWAAPHSHGAWELVVNVSGCGTQWIEGEKSEFAEGTITLCPPGLVHEKKAGARPFQDLYLQFTPSKAAQPVRSYYFQDDSDRSVETLCRMLHTVYHGRQKGYQEIADALLEAVCRILYSWEKREEAPACVAQLQNLIIQKFSDPDFSVQQAMDQLRYCGDYIRRQFKAHTGGTPVAYLNAVRIENAKMLLAQRVSPRYSVSEAAYASGFYDVGYFSRVFKRLEGVSPQQYRQRLE